MAHNCFSLQLPWICSGLFSVAVITHWPKTIWGGKSLLHLTGLQSIIKEVKAEDHAGTEAGTIGGALLTVRFWFSAQLPILYR